LKTIRIKNFRSIKDSGIWTLTNDRINTLIGRNGSGKTSIIDALDTLKRNKIQDKDKPLEQPNIPTTISLGLLFSEEEKERVSFLNLEKDEDYTSIIEISKEYYSNGNIEYFINEKPSFTYLYKHINDIIELLKDKNRLGFKEGNNPVQLKERYPNMLSLINDIKRLKDQLNNNQKRLSNEKEILTEVKKNISPILNLTSEIENFDNKVSRLIPTFTIFKYEDYHPFEDRFLYNSDYPNVKILPILMDELETSFKTLKNNANNPQIIEQISDNRNKELESYINENWPRDGAEVQLKIYPNEFAIMVKELDAGIFLYLSQRSGGEIWVFIYLTFIHRNIKNKQDTIILMDEPSINLHPYAQRNIVALMENFLEKNKGMSIIYTTHTPYLIKPKKIERLALVKRLDKEGSVISQIDYEKLLELKNSRSGKKQKLENIKQRLHQILSVSVREGFFGVMVLICEGITELLSLPIWAQIYNTDFDESGIIIIPAGGKELMLDFADFFAIYNIPIFLVFDNDNKPEKGEDYLKKERKLNSLFLEFFNEEPIDFPFGLGKQYFAFERDYESCLSNEDEKYDEYKDIVGNKFGSSRKSVRAMNIAMEYQLNNRKPPASIKALIEGIFRFRDKIS
ncbi:MAG: ATP-dependent endonuclease, partial [Promethearchaeota archaeon]